MEENKTITISEEEFINTVAKISADVFAKKGLALSMTINYIGAYLTTVLFDTKEEK